MYLLSYNICFIYEILDYDLKNQYIYIHNLIFLFYILNYNYFVFIYYVLKINKCEKNIQIKIILKLCDGFK
jgi:hypothetical protein